MEEKFLGEMMKKISELTADMSQESAIGFVDYLIEELRIYAKGLGERDAN
jgi:hypothetical protein